MAVQVQHKLPQAAIVAEHPLHGGFPPLVPEHNADALVQESHLLQAVFQHVKLEIPRVKDALRVVRALHVRQEADGGARAVGLPHHLQVVQVLAPGVFLLIDFPVLEHLHGQMRAQGVHHRGAHPVQSAGHLVASAAKLAARVQHRQAHLHRRAAHLGMDAHGEAAAVILHGYAAILMQGDVDLRAIPCQGLVDGVVHNFIYEMMQAPGIRGADIHARALAHGFQAFQHLDLLLAIVPGHFRGLLNLLIQFVRHAAPRFVLFPAVPQNLEHKTKRPTTFFPSKRLGIF